MNLGLRFFKSLKWEEASGITNRLDAPQPHFDTLGLASKDASVRYAELTLVIFIFPSSHPVDTTDANATSTIL